MNQEYSRVAQNTQECRKNIMTTRKRGEETNNEMPSRTACVPICSAAKVTTPFQCLRIHGNMSLGQEINIRDDVYTVIEHINANTHTHACTHAQIRTHTTQHIHTYLNNITHLNATTKNQFNQHGP